MTNWPILSTVTFLPLLGALLLLLIRGDEASERRNIYWLSLWTTLITFLVSLLIWRDFDNANTGFQFVERTN